MKFTRYYGIPKEVEEEGYKGFMERFPILFQNKDKSMMETCMCWGIECPIGWYHILEQLCTYLEYQNILAMKSHHYAIIAEQVKEKFGTLRFYINIRKIDDGGIAIDIGDDEDMTEMEKLHAKVISDHMWAIANEVITEAENMTETTCAECGEELTKENEVVTQGWITYICKDCDEKRRKQDEIEEQEVMNEGKGGNSTSENNQEIVNK